MALSSFALLACGDGGTPLSPPEGQTPAESEACEIVYDGTFAAIQDVIFERRGCTAEACHGSARSGGLDLRPESAYAALIEVPAVGADLPLVYPGDNDRSCLWRKVAAKTEPGSVEIAGSPMPSSDQTLSSAELELLRVWIKNGSPEEGTVQEAESLVDGGLPEASPITIAPLAAPAPGDGVQLVMPSFLLPAGAEREVCIAQYYDLSDQIPPEFLNEAGTHFLAATSELRQDPQSHHLVLAHNASGPPFVGFGEFSCRGGRQDGEPCAPTDLASCEGGVCAGAPTDATDQTLIADSVQCLTFGPPGTFNTPVFIAQQSQERKELVDGVYVEVPVEGLWIWNSHAFNLTSRDHEMNARINYWFARETVYPVQSYASIKKQYAHQIPPFGTETLCAEDTFPRGARLFNLLSHYHQRGRYFWVEGPDGELTYESRVYNDPVNKYFHPPLRFDSPDPAERTIRYCAYYENGVAPNGSPDPSTVKRRSKTPANSLVLCEPIACRGGRLAQPVLG